MSQIVTRQFRPTRYVASKRRFQCDLDSLTDASYDFLIDPVEQKLIHRGGSYLLGQTIKDGNEVTLQFEAATWGDLYARQIVQFQSDSISDGLPTHGVLYSNDSTAGTFLFMSPNTYTVANCSMASGSAHMTSAALFGDVTKGMRVQLVGLTDTARVVAITSTSDITLDMEADAPLGPLTATFGGPLYGQNLTPGIKCASTYPSNFKMVPVVGISNRCFTAAERAFLCLGSRRAAVIGNSVVFGNCASLNYPIRWNRLFNDQTSGTQNERIFPLGNIPPLWMFVADGSAALSGPLPNWKVDKSYFFSIMFRYADGSYSQPFVPQYKATAGNNFFGYHKVATACDYLTITLPIGPAEVEARIILRTAGGSDAVPPPLQDVAGNSLLGVAAIIENNVQTTYQLKQGNDGALDFDPVRVRFDRAWMRPARFLWTGDQRLWGCYTKVHPGCVILTCKIAANNSDDDNAASLAATSRYVSLTGTDGAATSLVATGLTSITVGASVSVQQLVDAINADAGGIWAAALVPGTDGGQSTETLLMTDLTRNFGNGVAGLRVLGNAQPCVLSFSTGYTGAFATQKQRVTFGIGGPGTKPFGPDTSVKNQRDGALAWGIAMGGGSLLDGQVVCFSEAIALCRNIHQGKTGLDDDYRLEALNETRGCISDASICSVNGCVGYATRDGYVITDGTREVIISADLYSPATGQGILSDPIKNCISAMATNDGEACARYFTAWAEGTKLYLGLSYAATSPSIASDPVLVYDFSGSASQSGLQGMLKPDGTPWGWSPPLAYGPIFPGVRSAVVGGAVGRLKDSGAGRRIVVASSYLSTTAAATPHGIIARIMEPTILDFTQLDLDGSTHTATATSASAALTAVSGDLSKIPVGAVCIEVTPTRIRVGSVVLSVSGTTVTLDRTAKSSGSVTIFFWGRSIVPFGYLATDTCGTMNMKALRHLVALYNQTGSGMQIRLTNTLDRTGSVTFSLPAVASADGFSPQRINLTQALQGLSKGYEPVIVDTGTTTQQSEFWGLESEVEILDSHR